MDIRDAVFNKLYELAKADPSVMVLAADTDAFALKKLKENLPKQFVNTSVAEQATILVAAGLALAGKKPFVYSIIPFITLRCFEHIKVNLCAMELPVTIIGLGAGLSFSADGPTHHATTDIGVMRTLGDEIYIYNPSNSANAEIAVEQAYRSQITPCYIRLDKGDYETLSISDYALNYVYGNGSCKDVIVSTGIMVHRAIEVAKRVGNLAVIELFQLQLNSVNFDYLRDLLVSHRNTFVLDENTKQGGISPIVDSIPFDKVYFTLPAEQIFVYGTREYLHKEFGLDLESLCSKIKAYRKGDV